VIFLACGDHDEMLAGDVEVTLQVMVGIPTDPRCPVGTDHRPKMLHRTLVGMVVVDPFAVMWHCSEDSPARTCQPIVIDRQFWYRCPPFHTLLTIARSYRRTNTT
jgi:hypothetical protein